jgi:hypothetical protein
VAQHAGHLQELQNTGRGKKLPDPMKLNLRSQRVDVIVIRGFNIGIKDLLLMIDFSLPTLSSALSNWACFFKLPGGQT